jgi:hypothetical protein
MTREGEGKTSNIAERMKRNNNRRNERKAGRKREGVMKSA